MAYQIIPPGGSAVDIEADFERLVAAAFNVSPNRLAMVDHSFTLRGTTGLSVTGGGGTGAAPQAVDLVSSSSNTRAHFAAGNTQSILTGASEKFALAWRGSLISGAIESGSWGGVGLWNGATELLVVGTHGATSTTNWVVYGDVGGVTINSGVALDANVMHDFLYIYDGTIGRFYLDGVLRGTPAAVRHSSSSVQAGAVSLASTATTRNTRNKWMAAATVIA
jgi:hypothetical protein